MSPRTGLTAIFLTSLVIGFSGVVAHIVVGVALRRRRIPVRFVIAGMPSYFLRLCWELPPSPERSRLVLLGRWSVIAFVTMIVGVGMSGAMLGSLDESERSNNRFARARVVSSMGQGGSR